MMTLSVSSTALPIRAHNDFKVTQAFSRKQRIRESHNEDSPPSPGNRYSGVLEGVHGMRLSAEHAVSATDPRRGMMSRASEARGR
jgi:hypothetical protein